MMTDVSKDGSASTTFFKMLITTHTMAQCQSQKTIICRRSQSFVFSFMGLMYIYFLTVIGLTPGGSSTVRYGTVRYGTVQYSTVQYSTHLHTNSTQNNTINLGRVRAVPRLCELYPHICLTTEEKARKNLSQGSQTIMTFYDQFLFQVKDCHTEWPKKMYTHFDMKNITL